MSNEARSRLCPEHQNDSYPTSCVQARRIAELGLWTLARIATYRERMHRENERLSMIHHRFGAENQIR